MRLVSSPKTSMVCSGRLCDKYSLATICAFECTHVALMSSASSHSSLATINSSLVSSAASSSCCCCCCCSSSMQLSTSTASPSFSNSRLALRVVELFVLFVLLLLRRSMAEPTLERRCCSICWLAMWARCWRVANLSRARSRATLVSCMLRRVAPTFKSAKHSRLPKCAAMTGDYCCC